MRFPTDPSTEPDTLPAEAVPRSRQGDFAGPRDEAGRTETVDPLRISRGDRIASFVVIGKIGAGGMGVVYRAFDPDLERTVAIKLHRGFGSDEVTARMLREARSMARLSHPNVVTIYEVGTHSGHMFIAMEYAQGGSLAGWLDAARRPWREVVALFVAAGRGLVAAHALGIIHRDFKADNVLLDGVGRPQIADFGLARTPGEDVVEPTRVDQVPLDSERLTAAGAAMGTPLYMPPEQYGGESVTAAADQFAFCASLFEALYGHSPFDGKSLAERLVQIMNGDIKPPGSSSAPARLFPILRRGLAAKADARHADMETLLAELTRDPAARRRRTAVVLGLCAATAVAAGLAWNAAPPNPCVAAARAFAGTWNDQRSEAINEAFGTSPGTQAAREQVLRTLDEFSSSWTRSRRDACEATHTRGEQSEAVLDQRNACLDRAKAQFDGVTRVLERADPSMAERALEVLGNLPSIAGCEDIEALRAAIAAPHVGDAEAVAAVRAGIAEIDASMTADILKGADSRADDVVRAASEIDYEPVNAEAVYTRARVRERLGRYEGAREDFESTLMLAVEIGMGDLAARAAAKLAFSVGIHDRQAADARRLLRLARAYEAKTPSMRAQLLIEGVAVALARDSGDLEAAVAHASRAVELRIELADGDATAASTELSTYAVTLEESGQSAEATRQFDRIVELVEARYGPTDGRLLGPLRAVAIQRTLVGDTSAARITFERRVGVAEAAHGSGSLVLVEALVDFAQACLTLPEVATAERTLERARAIFEGLEEQDSEMERRLLSVEADTLRLQGRCDKALLVFDKIDSIYAQAQELDDRTRILSLNDRFPCVAEIEGDQAAYEIATRALALNEEFFGEHSLSLVHSLGMVDVAARAIGDHAQALDAATRALGLLTLHQADHGHLAASLRLARARSLHALGQRDEARDALLAALDNPGDDAPTGLERAAFLYDVGLLLGEYDDQHGSALRAMTQAQRAIVGDSNEANTLRHSITQWRSANPPA